MVWTLTTTGITERAYATLRVDYFVDNLVQASEQGALGAGRSDPTIRANIAPVLRSRATGIGGYVSENRWRWWLWPVTTASPSPGARDGPTRGAHLSR